MRMPRVAKLALFGSFALATAVAAQIPFTQATLDLASASKATRLRAAQLLKETAYPEAAVPLAKVVVDPQDDVQLEAIAGELNIFLAEKVVERKRVGFLIEVRNPIAAEAVFSTGPLALGPRPVPLEVLAALRAAARDDNPRVALEALYAFGVLAIEPRGSARIELLHSSGPDLAAMIGVPDIGRRFAAVRVIGRVFEWRVTDEPIEPALGDAVITALNDDDRTVRSAAMQALGTMRYSRGLQALTDLFQHYGKGELAEAALDAIARIAHASSADLLIAQASSKNAMIKLLAIEGLARLGDPGNAAVVGVALGGERNDTLRLAGAFAAATLSDGTLDPIVDAVQKPKLREQAREYLVQIASWRSAAFARYLQSSDARIRIDLVDALGLGYAPDGLPLVEPLLKDRDPRVARAAERAVARLRGAVPPIQR